MKYRNSKTVKVGQSRPRWIPHQGKGTATPLYRAWQEIRWDNLETNVLTIQQIERARALHHGLGHVLQ
jgi:hypothetical protein